MTDRLATAMRICAIMDRDERNRQIGFNKWDYTDNETTGSNACHEYALDRARRAERLWMSANPCPPKPPVEHFDAPGSPTPLTPRERAIAAGWTVH